jgi:uncharacterized membrane protein (UPF0127 family)
MSHFKNLLIFLALSLGALVPSVRAIFDPLSVPNNRFGVHILDTDELAEAAKLVNSNGGVWGYVTIPMRSNDRDSGKWQVFFKKCADLKVIPIIRLATYPEKNDWVKPTPYDLVDFANFLSDMPWPTKNRYIILFNETNRANEWGGEISPEEYAALVIDAKRIFNSRSTDFFLLSAGLDMAVPNSQTSLIPYLFYQRMFAAYPDWCKYVDGFSSHAYPNPGFSASVFSSSVMGPVSYRYELFWFKSFGCPNLPVFITETGTINKTPFYTLGYSQVWTDEQIVTITPFLLFAADGDFAKFSLKTRDGKANYAYKEIETFSKVKGSPLLAVLQIPSKLETFKSYTVNYEQSNLWDKFKRLQVGNWLLNVEVAKDNESRTQGLSGRDKLDPDFGMLFIFDKPDKYSFWMKDMKFNLDFIWIRNKKVVQINTHISNPKTLVPNQEVDQVLEVAAGEVDKNSVKVGDEIK